MTNNPVNRVYNIVILDESGSMQSIKKSVIDGFNEIIQSIFHEAEKDKQMEQWLAFYSFNGAGLKEQIQLSLVTDKFVLDENNYVPDNTTPLYDAIGIVCNKTRNSVADKEGVKVLVTILTDGEENSSTEYNFEAIRSLILELQNNAWHFTYIGTDHDVEKVSLSLNIKSILSFRKTKEGFDEFVAKEKMSRRIFYNKIRSGKEINPNDSYFNENE